MDAVSVVVQKSTFSILLWRIMWTSQGHGRRVGRSAQQSRLQMEVYLHVSGIIGIKKSD